MTPKTCFITILGVLLYASFFLIACDSSQENKQNKDIQDLYQEIMHTDRSQIHKILSQSKYSYEIYDKHSEKIGIYKNIQEQIAKLIPNEYERPIIELKVYFNQKNHDAHSLKAGILGGIGPLSDANIMEKLAIKLQAFPAKNNFMIHLLSMPPPRTLWEKIMGGLPYLWRLYSFASLTHEQFFLASNTAHLNHAKFSLLVSTSVFHLPKTVRAQIKSKQQLIKDLEVLILDTAQANKGELYQTLLKEQDIDFTVLNKQHRQNLEHWIKRIKVGNLQSQDHHKFFLFVSELITHYQANTLILACTEIPLALSAYIPKLIENGIDVVDSESILIDAISEFLINPKLTKDKH